MSNVVLVKGNARKTAAKGTPAYQAAIAQGFKPEASEQDGAQMAGIMKQVTAKKREIALEPGTDLAGLRKEMEAAGLMKSGASVPANTPEGLCASAVCIKPTRLVLARAGDSYYLREDFKCTASDGMTEFTAFALNSGIEFGEGESAELYVVPATGTQSGLGLTYTNPDA